MLAILHDVTANTPDRPVWFVHSARHGRAHALGAEVDALVRANTGIRRRIHYSAPSAMDVAGKDFDGAGRLSAHELLALQVGPDAHYMLCGPASFLADIRSGLEAGGVAPGRIHAESFGPSP
jgi:ferredoxin-NADP reductase